MTGQTAINEIVKNKEIFISLAKKIWDNPEVGYKEFKAVEWTSEVLKQFGFDVEVGAFGVPTAIKATWGHGKPVIGFLGEYDALPRLSQTIAAQREPIDGQEYGHGCGHNLICAGHLAAAVGMKKEMEENKLSGTVIFYGCPAEEIGTGKGMMAKGGAFKDLDAAIAYHPSWFNYIFTGTKAGVQKVRVDFQGKSSHAGSTPYNGRSALLAAELANHATVYIHEQLPPGCGLHYAVIDGGYSPGEIPEFASANYSMKAPDLGKMEQVYERLVNIVNGAALMSDTKASTKRLGGCYPLLNNHVLANVAYDAMTSTEQEKWSDEEIEFAKQLNTTTEKQWKDKLAELGADENTQLHYGVLPMRVFDTNGSTDVGDVSYITPTIFFKVACYAVGTNGHKWQTTACSGSSAGMKGMLFAAKVMAKTGLKLIENQQFLSDAKSEFETATKDCKYICSISD